MIRNLNLKHIIPLTLLFTVCSLWDSAAAEEARLLRQPTISETQIAFAHAGDLWIVERSGGKAVRLTSTAAVESNPHFSPDGSSVAFTSNRSGTDAVYVMPVEGGTPKRLTWYPAGSIARGWSPDSKRILYSSTRETAPTGYGRLWTVSPEGGPSTQLPAPIGNDGSFSPSGKRIIVDQATRWDSEWRNYRGGQNKPLRILNLDTLEEIQLPNDNTVDLHPVWSGEKIYFLSDRDWVMNIWSWDSSSSKLEQLTDFDGVDIKWLDGIDDTLVFERDGFIHTLDTNNGGTDRVKISLSGDFAWSETRWEDVGTQVRSSSLSPTGKRALFEARGDIFTVPVEKGSSRNITRSSGGADRAPTWSPKGTEIAWFSDSGNGYSLFIADQDGLANSREIPIGESKMAWETTWSPDGSRIAFVDDDVRIRVLDVESGEITTADVGGANIERGSMGLTWSPDSKWLAYAKSFPNNYRRIVVWSPDDGQARTVTNSMADAFSPSWSRDGKHLYLLASTNLGLGSGWANTSTIGGADPEYGVYAILLKADESSPFSPESDEEKDPDKKEDSDDDDDEKIDAGKEEQKKEQNDDEKNDDQEASDDKLQPEKDAGDKDEKEPPVDKTKDEDAADQQESGSDDKANQEDDEEKASDEDKTTKKTVDGKSKEKVVEVKIDFDGIDHRLIHLPLPVANYRFTLAGPEGSMFVGENKSGSPGLTLHKFVFKDRKVSEFLKGAGSVSLSSDGKKLLYRSGSSWMVCDTASPPTAGKGKLDVNLQMRLDRGAEWEQMFNESWRYLRDFFYDPETHGRDWDVVRDRYAPLLPHIHHRADLNYVMDQMSGELSVGHSFVFGGDMPDVENNSRVGVLGADLEIHEDRWRIDRIYTFESWNPNLRAPLDRAGLKVKKDNYLVGVDGVELTAADDPYQLLDGTAGRQTVLHINDKPTMDGSWKAVVEPIRSESTLRQRAWVEDNRRRVDELSDGKLAYIWVPNTGQPGVVSFNRYFFAQQDRQGAIIDERFNGGGLLDDYMVDLMTRRLRAAITNEVPGGRPFRLPAGILGPKVLLINELAGSGGDFFPWVFRQQEAGPLIGTRTWGGLVKSSVHYPLVDGGALTSPDNAVFDPIRKSWIGENVGIAPDIEVQVDAKSVSQGRDPQLERGVKEALRLLSESEPPLVEPPPYPKPAKRPAGR